jgi:hypothetical protein
VIAPGMKGTLETFIRPPPQEQATFADLKRRIAPAEFAGHRALVVGGSRGLGEVTSKLLAAGGAEVRLTYFRGSQDARRVAEEIVAGGGHAQALPFDVVNPRPDLANDLRGWIPTQLYYFATPYIAPSARGVFSSRLFRSFCDYYVLGLHTTVQSLRALGPGLQGIFYPSSTFVQELSPNMSEYVAAKAAGETLCDVIQKSIPGLKIYRPRLPKTATDQTASLFPTPKQDPVAALLEHLLRMNALLKPSAS